jgi:hypothetical protein
MGNKHHRKAIDSLNQRIAEHQEKIRLESQKDFPDKGLIQREFDKPFFDLSPNPSPTRRGEPKP